MSVDDMEVMFGETHFPPARVGVDMFQGRLGHPGMAMESSHLRPMEEHAFSDSNWTNA